MRDVVLCQIELKPHHIKHLKMLLKMYLIKNYGDLLEEESKKYGRFIDPRFIAKKFGYYYVIISYLEHSLIKCEERQEATTYFKMTQFYWDYFKKILGTNYDNIEESFDMDEWLDLREAIDGISELIETFNKREIKNGFSFVQPDNLDKFKH